MKYISREQYNSILCYAPYEVYKNLVEMMELKQVEIVDIREDNQCIVLGARE